jgi:hypothetical protein
MGDTVKLRAECVKEPNGEITLSVWIGRRCALSATIDSGYLMPELHEEIGAKIEEAINKHAAPIGAKAS